MRILQPSPRLPFAGQPPNQIRPNSPALSRRSDLPEADRLTLSQPKFAGSVKFGSRYGQFAELDEVDHDGNTMLMMAVDCDDHESVNTFLEYGANIDHQNQWGNTALHWASRKGHHDIASTLLNKKADVNIPNRQGNTPLAMAARNGDEKMANLLLKQKPDVDYPNVKGDTPIMQAAKKGKSAMVSLLREHGAREDIRTEDGKTVDMLLAEGMAKAGRRANRQGTAAEAVQQHVGWGGWLNKGLLWLLLATAGKPVLQWAYDTVSGTTPSIKAANFGNLAQSRKLLAQGKNPHQTEGWSKRDYATRAGHTQMIKELQAIYKKQIEVLVQKAGDGDRTMVHKLLAQGLDIDQPNQEGITPLGKAVKNSHPTMVEFLIDQGADVNKKYGPDENSPLIEAVKSERTKVIQKLIQAKANVNQADKDGNTSLILAAANGNRGIVKTLIKTDVDVNQKNKEGMTALMTAADAGEFYTAELLLGHGADFNLKNNAGKTVLDIALDKNCVSILRFLRINSHLLKDKSRLSEIDHQKRSLWHW